MKLLGRCLSTRNLLDELLGLNAVPVSIVTRWPLVVDSCDCVLLLFAIGSLVFPYAVGPGVVGLVWPVLWTIQL